MSIKDIEKFMDAFDVALTGELRKPRIQNLREKELIENDPLVQETRNILARVESLDIPGEE